MGVLIESVSGATPSRALTEQVHSRTEGNPLFVTEVVRLLASEMETDAEYGPDASANAESWSARIPDGVREAIGTRLYRMSPETNRILAVASVVSYREEYIRGSSKNNPADDTVFIYRRAMSRPDMNCIV